MQPTNTMKTLVEIKAIILENRVTQAGLYVGLTSSEIGEYNMSLMFGDNKEGFPSEEEWSTIVD